MNNSKTNLLVTILLSTIAIFGLIMPSRAKNNTITGQTSPSNNITSVGPRMNIPTKSPSAYGFWSFSIPMTGTISRSGQPTLDEFKWLKKQGWKSVINLRADKEYKEVADDMKIKGFKDLGFNYLWLPIRDGAAPTNAQAKKFLTFVGDKKNQPIHIHCRGGYGRTGTLVALYRYEIQGWKMDDAITESRLYHGGISTAQKSWLKKWEKSNKK